MSVFTGDRPSLGTVRLEEVAESWKMSQRRGRQRSGRGAAEKSAGSWPADSENGPAGPTGAWKGLIVSLTFILKAPRRCPKVSRMEVT